MRNRQIRANINKLDQSINGLIDEFNAAKDEAVRTEIKNRMESLVKMRCELAESKTNESKELMAGLIGFSATALVLAFEKTDIITMRNAFNQATKLFRGK